MDDTSDNLIHRRAWDLIPWVVNETASADDRRLVDDHLARCADCREELAFHRALQAGIAASPPLTGNETEPALSRLWARIDRSERDDPDASHPAALLRSRRSRWIGGLAAVVAAQAIALGTLAGLLYGRHAPVVGYETLSRPPSPSGQPTMRLVVSPDMRLGELRALLDRAGLQIVQSSGDGAILGLAPAAGRTPHADALSLLRTTTQVLLAEPVEAPAAPTR